MMDQTALVIRKHDITSIPEVEIGFDVNDQSMFRRKGVINASRTDSKLNTLGTESVSSSIITPNNMSEDDLERDREIYNGLREHAVPYFGNQ